MHNFLPNDFLPGPMDVICARGRKAYCHPGNQRYRKIIERNLAQYSTAASKSEKSRIVSSIIESVRESSLCADFVQLKGGRWFLVEESMVREKIGQSFRDVLHTKYRSSNKAKKQRRRQKENMNLKKSLPPPKIISNTDILPPTEDEYETTMDLTAENIAWTEAYDIQPFGLNEAASSSDLSICASVESYNAVDLEIFDMEPIPFAFENITSQIVHSTSASEGQC